LIDVLTYIREVYSHNAFVQLNEQKIDAVSCGEAQLSMVVSAEKHTNLYGAVHGGALEALADTALGVVCATVGVRVVTVSFAMSFIKNVHAGECLLAKAKLVHHGRTTMVVKVTLFNEADENLAEILATMLNIGTFDEIPKKW
jgi:uncharacterized protein (TIGR00369 family)